MTRSDLPSTSVDSTASVAAPNLTTPEGPGIGRASESPNFWRRHGLLVYVLRRLLACVVTVIAGSALVFLAIMVLPGDVVDAVLGRTGSAEQVEALRDQVNGDDPLWQRYATFMWDFVHGDFGYSTASVLQGSPVPVSDLIGPAMWHSFILAMVTLVLFIPIMLILGLTAGLKPGSRRDNLISTTSLAVGALPEYFVAAVLVAVFFTRLDLLPPVSSFSDDTGVLEAPSRLVLPIATLLLVSLAFGSRQLRGSVANILAQDYVTYARLNGYSQAKVVRRYILPNSIGPTVQIVAQQLMYLLTGLVIVETVFNYPGIGNLFVRSINAQDVQMILVIATILAVVSILLQLLADVAALLVDPVQRTSL